MSQKYEGVTFGFAKAGPRLEPWKGVVTEGPNEMVLEVEYEGDRPYVIKGIDKGGYFEGEHQGLPDDGAVTARWARIGDRWMGQWIEADKEYLFTFKL